MPKSFEDITRQFFNTPQGAALSDKKSDLDRLVSSPDGQKVKEMIDSKKLEEALQSGDTDALRQSITSVMQTQSGARLIKQLETLFGGK